MARISEARIRIDNVAAWNTIKDNHIINLDLGGVAFDPFSDELELAVNENGTSTLKLSLSFQLSEAETDKVIDQGRHPSRA